MIFTTEMSQDYRFAFIHDVQQIKTGTWTIQENVLEYIFEINICNSVLTEFEEC